ncbi:S8 family peptidase [Pseudorhodoferax sp.]|uniref:S8 family peptidase n=1 Tax=Pseudorhodoferax sp. TaxID=1993553 RepID=UPI002DD6290C|nr:S8 family peptidase [Pseudorhodoferax sp.]
MATKPHAPAEIIVIARPDAQLRAAPGAAPTTAGATVDSLNALLKAAKVQLHPLFGATEERVATWISPSVRAAAPEHPDPATFYTVVGDLKNHKALVDKLLAEPTVLGAYYKPPGEPPEMDRGLLRTTKLDAAPQDMSPAATPDFNTRQGYLDAAPGGIDARFGWTKSGGRGDNVRVIDLEWGWNFSHEDLLANSGGLLDGSNAADTDHGTAVIGVIGGDNNGFGVLGIAPNARVSAISFNGNSSAQAIRKAADRLQAGDVILLEIHRPGPRATGSGQMGYIGIEWWPDDFAAILYATSRGIVVVEAAGNGFQNLDDPVYSTRPTGFPAGWRNPFNRANPQCGAILVGAGAPPPGTHGRNHGADRSRLDFSNWGSAVDVQGWGREVTTTGRSWGVADLHNGGGNAWYTDQFSGTSSASPVVVGAVAVMQGWLRAAGKPLLTSVGARDALRATGTPQQDEPGRPATQRIGNRPNLRSLHARLFPKLAIKDAKDAIKEKDKDKELLKERIKEQVKDVKEKDFKEKEFKEIKEFEKPKDRKDMVEVRITPRLDGGPAGDAQPPLQERIDALEAAVTSLLGMLPGAAGGAHFIGSELRPDVGASAYDAEPPPDDAGADPRGRG